MKKVINYLTGIFLIFISSVGILHFMAAESVIVKTKMLKHKIAKGGVVYNNTSSTIKISCDTYASSIPANKSSVDIGIKDVDAIIIDKPMYFQGKTIENKVLKFCDLGVIELTENEEKEITIKDKKLSWICKLAKDFTVYDSVKSAFKR